MQFLSVRVYFKIPGGGAFWDTNHKIGVKDEYSHHNVDSEEDGNRLSVLVWASLKNKCFIVYFEDQFFKVLPLTKKCCCLNSYVHNNNNKALLYTYIIQVIQY